MRGGYPWYIFTLFVTFAIAFSVVQAVCVTYRIPPFFTPNASFNARLAFLKRHMPATPAIVVSGSSIAVYDIDTDFLQSRENKPVIDIGIDGIPVEGVHRFFDQYRAIGQASEVIVALQPYDTQGRPPQYFEVSDRVFNRYVRGRMTWAEEMGYRDLAGLYQYFRMLPDLAARDNASSAAYSETGSVPLERNDSKIGRWNDVNAVAVERQCDHCVEGVEAYCTEVTQSDLPFTLFLAPLQPRALDLRPDLRAVGADRRARLKDAVRRCGGVLFDASEHAAFADACFEDAVHLNARGMRAVTTLFEQVRRGDTPTRKAAVDCAAPV